MRDYAITPLSSPGAAAKKKVPKARFTQAARTSSDNSEERTRDFRSPRGDVTLSTGPDAYAKVTGNAPDAEPIDTSAPDRDARR